ncbi:MAG: T9SS type A sorting domain-containing protein [Flavobacteriales bacterium]
MQNTGTILVNGSYNNDIAITGWGVFCKNGSWVNDASGSLNGITDANMDSYFTADAYGCTDCCVNASTLPVQLVSFLLKRNGNSVDVSWTTASEINNDFFEVEFSRDGDNWSTIAYIDGAVTTNTISDYHFQDTDISGFDIKYYRLKQVDFDGSVHYSNIKWVQIADRDGNVEVYETQDEINVMLNYKAPISQIMLIDVNGQVINQQLQGVIQSKNVFAFSKSNLASGVYFVQVVSANEVLSKKFVVHK